MGRRFAEIAFTPSVQEEQSRHGSRKSYARIEQATAKDDRLGISERTFIQQRDGFYMASVTETGWPYIQYRGGPPGFVHVLDDHTLGFADLRGNKQYISVGNFKQNDRLALFFMDYTTQSRLKVFGRVTIHEDEPEAPVLIRQLRTPGENAPAERALIVHVEAWDWNCPQHITPRYTQEELVPILAPLRERLQQLEAQVEAGRSRVSPPPG